jgi:hypothetical protein
MHGATRKFQWNSDGLAAGIPGANFVVLQSNNHILLEQDSAAQRFFEEIGLFLKG